MPREERTETLVVGAGPVGMTTALLLARAGVQVRIIDQEWRTASRTYACALHPPTLKLLDSLGLLRDIRSAGREVSKVCFYEGDARRAEANLSLPGSEYPFVLVLPQSALEDLLEQKLKAEGVQVQWNHQLSGLRAASQDAVGIVDKLGVSAKGFIVPEMEWSVEKTDEVRASFVVGADGPNSYVAQSLAAGNDASGSSEFYAVYEFQTDWEPANELRVVLDKGTTSVLWPLAGGKFRWSFQLREEHLREFPSKERKALQIDAPAADKQNRDFMQKLLRERAPWFKAAVKEIGWATDVEFEHRVAKKFGQGRCWLVGDAAHQTGPAGMQSMNRGMLEAEQLALALTKILREKASFELLETYDRASREEWQLLLGVKGSLKPRPKTDGWVRERAGRMLSCIPASGEDVRRLLDQLQLDLVN
jgi:2-polyprenyl-6-methoxyphenol hydroxylase-like FAD-dependent oxidoreductase